MLPSIFSGVRVARSFVLCVVFRRFLFVLLLFFMSFFNLRLLITPLVSSNFSYGNNMQEDNQFLSALRNL